MKTHLFAVAALCLNFTASADDYYLPATVPTVIEVVRPKWDFGQSATLRYSGFGIWDMVGSGDQGRVAVFAHGATGQIALRNESGFWCYWEGVALPSPPYVGVTVSTTVTTKPVSYLCEDTGAPFWGKESYQYAATGLAIQRLVLQDGSSVEVLPIRITRDRLPWQTYYFGLGLGLVKKTSEMTPQDGDYFVADYQTRFDFVIKTQPQPVSNGSVVEYRNLADFPASPGGHFFYTADVGEQALVDSGAVGRFIRTGRSFKTGGAVSVCRFYGSMSPGPNSHFYSASLEDCDGLKALEVKPTPQTVQQWNYEGQGFRVSALLTSGGCMSGTVPLYRAYNGAYADGRYRGFDSNHRYSTNRADIEDLVTQFGWADEGSVMCVIR